jgi:hypothetical protein
VLPQLQGRRHWGLTVALLRLTSLMRVFSQSRFVAIATVQGGVPKGSYHSRLHGCFQTPPQNLSVPSHFHARQISVPGHFHARQLSGSPQRELAAARTHRLGRWPAANFSQGKQAAVRTHRLGDRPRLFISNSSVEL